MALGAALAMRTLLDDSGDSGGGVHFLSEAELTDVTFAFPSVHYDDIDAPVLAAAPATPADLSRLP